MFMLGRSADAHASQDRAERRPQAVTDRTRRPAAGPPRPGAMPPAAIMALQRSVGNAAVGRMLAEEQPRQQSGPGGAVAEVLRSPGQPLAEPLRAEMEGRLGADFRAVRLHTGPAARQSASTLGARAYTVGEDVVIGESPTDPHMLAHELTHVLQQRQGPVAGTDHGDGLRVSDPSDRFERDAEDNARRAMSRPFPASPRQHSAPAPAGPPPLPGHVQRYVVVQPGDRGTLVAMGSEPPQGGQVPATEGFFPGQEGRHREVVRPGGQQAQQQSYVDESGQINLVYGGAAPLRIAEKMDLAIEDVGPGRQAKAFYATEERINQANEQLQGRIGLSREGYSLTLHRTRRFLTITRPDKAIVLWQVVPETRNRPTLLDPNPPQQRGLDVQLAQRCDDMATAVTGRPGNLGMMGEGRYFRALATILGDLTTRSTAEWWGELEEVRNRAARNPPAHINQLTTVMANMIQRVMAFRDDPNWAPRLEAAYRRHKLNEFTPPAQIGDIFMIKALRGDTTSPGLDYHFAGVVAKSGPDHITMENYARHEEDQTLSSGDPQWYFQMYGPHAQSFHQAWGWAARFQPAGDNRLVLTILLHD
jgi:Domain of unknown function (DUF4157)